MEDESLVEETTTSPSDENNQVEETTNVSEDVKTPQEEPTEAKVPYDRFQEVVRERNQYKELLASQSTPQEPEPIQDDYDDTLKNIDKRTETIVNKKLNEVMRKAELDNAIKANPDFYQYADLIKDKIKENPNMSWTDAYKLSKYDVSMSEARETGKKEVYQKIAQKKVASVETAVKARTVTPSKVEDINPLAKGPDGKYLYTTQELKDILPHS